MLTIWLLTAVFAVLFGAVARQLFLEFDDRARLIALMQNEAFCAVFAKHSAVQPKQDEA